MPVGLQVGNKLYQRCDSCGDTPKDPDRGHLILYLDSGSIHCSRCGYHAFATLGEMMGIWGVNKPQDTKSRVVNNDPTGELIPPGSVGLSGRISYVEDRWVATGAEIFAMRNPSGETQGYHLRSLLGKDSQTRGVRAFGYYGERMPTLAETDSFLRIVEGPYDVVYPNDVCTFGLPDKAQLQQLNWRNLVICPDGDVFRQPKLLRGWFRNLVRSQLMIEGVEIIPNGMDPDECRAEDRSFMEWKEFKEWYWQQASQARSSRSISG